MPLPPLIQEEAEAPAVDPAAPPQYQQESPAPPAYVQQAAPPVPRRANKHEALTTIYNAMQQATNAAWQSGSLCAIGWDGMEGDIGTGRTPQSAYRMLEEARDECQRAAQRMAAASYLLLSMRKDR